MALTSLIHISHTFHTGPLMSRIQISLNIGDMCSSQVKILKARGVVSKRVRGDKMMLNVRRCIGMVHWCIDYSISTTVIASIDLHHSFKPIYQQWEEGGYG
jgi:hypothetical protein